MKKVIICPDPYNQNTWSSADVDDVSAYLKQQFTVFPQNTRIYHNVVAVENDVTPENEAGIKHLQSLEGTFYVVIYPSWIQFIYYAVVAIMAAYSVYSILTMPKPQSQQQGSSNNELQGRANRARLKGRIPDIYGTVRSYPDLIAVPYTYYENGIEVEECLMAIGRGFYQIHDFRDGDTPTGAISESSVSVYDPNTPITGDTAFYRIGDIFNNLPLSIKKSESINGQSLKPPSDTVISDEESNAGIYFTTGGVINRKNSAINFSSYFNQGDAITINGAEFGIADAILSGLATIKEGGIVTVQSDEDIKDYDDYKGLLLTGATFEYIIATTYPETEEVTTESTFRDLSGQYDVISVSRSASGSGYLYTMTLDQPNNVNFNWDFVTQDHTIAAGITLNKSANGVVLDGAYTVESVTESTITLTTPSGINSDWLKVPDLLGGSTVNLESSVDLDLVSDKWVGWFDVEFDDPTEAIFNFYFPQGLYNMTSKGKVGEGFVEITIQYKYLGESTIHTRKHYEYRNGNKDTFGITIRETLRGLGTGISFRIAKTRQKYGNSPVTECKVKDVFLAVQTQKSSYPDVTVVRTRTVATDGALSVKERKANCLVTRKLPVDGTGPLVATKDAGQALINMALDPYIGRRSVTELDIDQIKSELQEVQSYFGSPVATEFCYTFDDENLSFEEQAGMIASAVFCEAMRFGNKLRLKFEKPQENSVLLFNHRNKVIGSEVRTFKFGIDKDYDGVELEYTSPFDDKLVTYSVPPNVTLNNPLKIKTSGIRNDAVAKTRAWREWNKLLHQNVNCEFTALDESELLIRNDRILVADNTSIETQDGEIIAIDGLILTCSQNVDFVGGEQYYCQLQMQNATVDVVECVAGEFTNQIILTRPPLHPLVVDPDRYVKTLYRVVKAADTSKDVFMLSEMTPNDQMTNKLTCINYDDRYYQNDHDFI
ncbi:MULTISPECIES: host specificity factor TipJ family phage tail protein [Acinetobacter]|uniref:host specificity factor TipJ family phage tail protein n=1 Tax=Acinetobacter TaxID=469 RepID=UPI000C3E569D|nr:MULTISPECIES: host specificity factor TipJ family phage tail protein [unclassified Acinetobacter]MBC70417.1 hypothetical protein [Acinetobacter sp.]MBT51705.1 hypothetical protein [Acinetobacter sp.]